MDVARLRGAVFVHGAEDALRRGARHLQGNPPASHRVQHVLQVPAVEGDLRGIALHHRVELAFVAAHFVGARADAELARHAALARRHDQPDDAAPVAREDGGNPRLPLEFVDIHNHARVELRGDELVVVRERALDELRHHLDVVPLEQHLGALRVDAHLHGQGRIADEAGEFAQGPRRHDHLDRLRRRLLQLDIGHGQAEAVGGGEGEPRAVALHVDAGQHRPRIIAGGGELHPFDGPAERLRVEPHGHAVPDLRHAREVGRVHGVDGRIVPRALDAELAAVRRRLERNGGGRQVRHEVADQAGRHGRRARLIHLRAHPGDDRDIEVRRGEPELAVLGLEEDVRDDRDGGPGGHGPADDGEAALEVFLEDLDFHVFTRLIRFADPP